MIKKEKNIAFNWFEKNVYIQPVYIRLGYNKIENICIGIIYAGTFREEESTEKTFFESDVLICEEKIKLAKKLAKDKLKFPFFRKTLIHIKKQENLPLNFMTMMYLWKSQKVMSNMYFDEPFPTDMKTISEIKKYFNERFNTIII